MTQTESDIRTLLRGGYAKFREAKYREQKDLYEKLGTGGQAPRVMLLSCSDSRVDPTDIFHAYPGEMFVIRNVANMMPPRDGQEGFAGTASAIEFGVKALGVEAIVVLGHESCGGCAGALNGLGDLETEYLGDWVGMMKSAADAVREMNPAEPERAMEREAVKLSMANLMTYPFIAERVESGALELVGMWFSIIRGELRMLEGDDFAVVDAA